MAMAKLHLLRVLPLVLLCSCATQLAPGPYNGDKVLYNADLAITTAYDVCHRFVKWEYDNQVALMQFPEVKKAADKVRVNAPGLINSAISLREVYVSTGSSESRDSLLTIVALLRQLTTEAVKNLAEHTDL